ncbi:MAG: YdcF family protein [Magnetococcales bacterium]|nr:YdcF family protein [Magnetococcales bacterium]
MGPVFNIVVERLLLPPGIVLILMGWAIWRLRRGAPKVSLVLLLGWALLYLANVAAVGELLHRGLESAPILRPSMVTKSSAEAIVILGHSRYPKAPEYGGDTLNPGGLVRARYGAWLHRKSGLPILTSGGHQFGEALPESVLMKRVLEEEFGVPVRWTEEESRNTFENARESAAVLSKEGVKRVLLVTHHRDMPRAVWAFERVGLEVVPASTLVRTQGALGWMDWIPEAGNAYGVRVALHEMMGRVWYKIRY